MKKILLFGIMSLALSSCTNQDDDIAVNSIQTQGKEQKNSLKQASVFGVPVYRFYGGGMGHYYTYYYNDGINAGYTPEGILGYSWVGAGGEATISRWYNRKNGDRILTTNPSELNGNIYAYSNESGSILYHTINTNGAWIQEGEMGKSWSPGLNSSTQGSATAIYRYNNSKKNRHFFTNNIYEMGPGKDGYVYESIAFYLGN